MFRTTLRGCLEKNKAAASSRRAFTTRPGVVGFLHRWWCGFPQRASGIPVASCKWINRCIRPSTWGCSLGINGVTIVKKTQKLGHAHITLVLSSLASGTAPPSASIKTAKTALFVGIFHSLVSNCFFRPIPSRFKQWP